MSSCIVSCGIAQHVLMDSSGFSKDELFSISLKWAQEDFRHLENVVEFQDREKGLIVGNGYLGFMTAHKSDSSNWLGVYVKYKFKIELSDNRYRLTLFDVMCGNKPESYWFSDPPHIENNEKREETKKQFEQYRHKITTTVKYFQLILGDRLKTKQIKRPSSKEWKPIELVIPKDDSLSICK